jgi:hypothetical protein
VELALELALLLVGDVHEGEGDEHEQEKEVG